MVNLHGCQYLTAALDTVNHNILLWCLETTFSFHGTLLQWLGSYLKGQTQSLVFVNDLFTAPQAVGCGIHQGSVLGALLLVLYTAEIGKVIRQHGLGHHT